MKVLQLEHAGLFTGPNILWFANGRAAAAIRRFAGVPEPLKRRALHYTFIGAELSLGGVRRSFAASPWRKSGCIRRAMHPRSTPLAALLLAQILPVFSVVAPCHPGASPVSMRRQTFVTGC